MQTTAQKHAIRGVAAFCGKQEQNKYDFVSDFMFKNYVFIKMSFFFFLIFFSPSQTKSTIEIQHVWLPVSRFHPGKLLISLYNIHSNNKERKESQFRAFSFSFCHLFLPAGPLSIEQVSSFSLIPEGAKCITGTTTRFCRRPMGQFARFLGPALRVKPQGAKIPFRHPYILLLAEHFLTWVSS